MNEKLQSLIARIREAEEEIEQELQRKRAELHADFEDKRAHFAREILDEQRRFKTSIARYLSTAQLRNIVSAPIIYSMLIPIVLMDAAVSFYQYTCFFLYGIPYVRRRDFMVFDRAQLGYLNVIEKLNCAYCSYGNGVAAYVREIVARTEQYWCPIKHSRRIRQAHAHYNGFVDFGDAEAYRRELQTLRKRLSEIPR